MVFRLWLWLLRLSELKLTRVKSGVAKQLYGCAAVPSRLSKQYRKSRLKNLGFSSSDASISVQVRWDRGIGMSGLLKLAH